VRTTNFYIFYPQDVEDDEDDIDDDESAEEVASPLAWSTKGDDEAETEAEEAGGRTKCCRCENWAAEALCWTGPLVGILTGTIGMPKR